MKVFGVEALANPQVSFAFCILQSGLLLCRLVNDDQKHKKI